MESEALMVALCVYCEGPGAEGMVVDYVGEPYGMAHAKCFLEEKTRFLAESRREWVILAKRAIQ